MNRFENMIRRGKRPRAAAAALNGDDQPLTTGTRPVAHIRAKSAKYAFTLIEILVAVTLLVTAMSLIAGTFTSIASAWRSGRDLLASLHHGDFVMDQTVTALRSAAFRHGDPAAYGFRLQRETGRYPADRISWVTASSAFIPPDHTVHGLHRIELSIEDHEGEPAFTVRAWPPAADRDNTAEPQAWPVSYMVQGLQCRIGEPDGSGRVEWHEDWEDTNSIPGLVEITLFITPPDDSDEPVIMRRAVAIPVHQAAGERGSAATPGSDHGERGVRRSRLEARTPQEELPATTESRRRGTRTSTR